MTPENCPILFWSRSLSTKNGWEIDQNWSMNQEGEEIFFADDAWHFPHFKAVIAAVCLVAWKSAPSVIFRVAIVIL